MISRKNFIKIQIIWLLCFGVIFISYFPDLKDSVAIIKKGFGDYRIFYTAGKIIIHNESTNLYNLNTQKQFFPNKNPKYFLSYFHPPFEGLLFIPFAMFDYLQSHFLWTIFTFILIILSSILISFIYKEVLYNLDMQKYTFFTPSIIFITMLSFYPVIITFINGQDSILFLFLILLSIYLLIINKNLISGLILGLTILKPQLAIPIIVGMSLRKNFIIGVVLSSLFCTLASFLMIGRDGICKAAELLKVIKSDPKSIFIPSEMFPNIRGLIERKSELLSLPVDPLVSITIWFIGVLFIFILNYFNSKNEFNAFKFLILNSINILVAILISYYINAHDLTILIIPIFTALFVAQYLIMRNINCKLLKFLLIVVFLMITPLIDVLTYRLVNFEMFIMLILVMIYFFISFINSYYKECLYISDFK